MAYNDIVRKLLNRCDVVGDDDIKLLNGKKNLPRLTHNPVTRAEPGHNQRRRPARPYQGRTRRQ